MEKFHQHNQNKEKEYLSTPSFPPTQVYSSTFLKKEKKNQNKTEGQTFWTYVSNSIKENYVVIMRFKKKKKNPEENIMEI